MRRKFNIGISIFEIIMGILAIMSFFYLLIRGDNVSNFIPVIFVSIGLILMGVAGFVNDKRNRKLEEKNDNINNDNKKNDDKDENNK